MITIILASMATVLLMPALGAILIALLADDPDQWKFRLGCGGIFVGFVGGSALLFYLAANQQ